MEHSTKTAVLLKAFDSELRSNFKNNLKAFKASQLSKNNMAFLKQIGARLN